MEQFYFLDIFSTKGIEYLLVIAFLLAVVPFWLWLQRPTAALQQVVDVPRAVPEMRVMRELRPPEGYFIDGGHTWAYMTREGLMNVGVDDFLTGIVGKLDGIRVPAVGEKIRRGDALVGLRLGGRELVVPAPLDGEVEKVHDLAVAAPDKVVADPYGQPVLSLRLHDYKEAIAPLHVGARAAAFLREDLNRLSEFITRSATPDVYLADGGSPVSGALANMDGELWEAFQKQFLR